MARCVTNIQLGFDASFVHHAVVSAGMVDQVVAELPGRRTVKGAAQAAWIMKAVSCLDLTTLSGADTPEHVRRLCQKALQPLSPQDYTALDIPPDRWVTTGGVCVYENQIPAARKVLNGKVPLAVVTTGFPAGQTSLDIKLAEIRAAVEAGADELDMVIRREDVLTGNWEALYDFIAECRLACPFTLLKVILGVGDLGTLDNVAKASAVAILAGADFIKTSTGYEATNASLRTGCVMLQQIKRMALATGGVYKVGFKPAGGIRTAKDALAWLHLVDYVLGTAWLNPQLLRIGASSGPGSVITDLGRQFHHCATGRYADRESISL